MRSCIGVFYIALIAASGALHAQVDPDQLYRARDLSPSPRRCSADPVTVIASLAQRAMR